MIRFYDGDFEKLMFAHEKKVYNIAFGFFKNEADACDATQETFLKVYKNISSFKGNSSLSTWIYRVATNVCLDILRKNKNELSLDNEEDASYFQPVSDFGNPEQEAEQKQLSEIIQKALHSLSEEHRTVLILRDINGFTYSEIAGILDTVEGTVKSRIARARLKMRELLLNEGNFKDFTSSNSIEEV